MCLLIEIQKLHSQSSKAFGKFNTFWCYAAKYFI
jgi:hypothetical protein